MNNSIKNCMKVLVATNILILSSFHVQTAHAFNFTTDKEQLSDVSTWYLDTCYKEAEKVEDERKKIRDMRKKLLETTLAKYQPSETMITQGSLGSQSSSGGGLTFNTPNTDLDKLMSPTTQQCIDKNFRNKDFIKESISCAKGAVPPTIKNMNKYGYKSNLISSCKKHNIDPYLLLSLISIESNGNPTDKTGSYWGLCQVDHKKYKNVTDPAANIEAGCAHLEETAKYLGSTSAPYLLIAYNSGAGACKQAFKYACKKKNIQGTMDTVPIGTVMEDMGAYIHSTYGWSLKEKTEYYMKCGYAYELLKKQNALG